MKIIRNIIEIDEEACNGCGLCILDCAEGAIRIVNGKAKIISDKLCDGMGHCIGGCPQNALKVVQREADPFDIKAVSDAEIRHILPEQNQGLPIAEAGMVKTNAFSDATLNLNPDSQGGAFNWPVKLRLLRHIPLHSHILLVADCAAPVTPNFYERYAKDKILITVCPKFEDSGDMAIKLADMLRNAKPKSITAIRMEVPCCQGISMIAKGAANMAGVCRPVDIVLGRDGQELHDYQPMQARCAGATLKTTLDAR